MNANIFERYNEWRIGAMIAFIAAGARHNMEEEKDNMRFPFCKTSPQKHSLISSYFTEIRMILQIFSRDTMNGD